LQDVAPYSPGDIGFFGENGFTAVTAGAFPDEDAPAWHVLHISSSHINLIQRVFRALGLEFFYFTELRKRPRKKPLRVATFPGYIFVKFDPLGARRKYLYATPGVISILGDEEGELSALPDEIFERLRAEREDRGEDANREPALPWVPGAQLIVLTGPFASFPAICIGYAGGKVHASVTIFGRTTLAIFNPTDLEVVADPHES
jgi:transcription antitermination factor NusG